MKNLFLKTLVVLGFLAFIPVSYGQFSIDGQFRTRAEYRDGYRKLASDATFAAPMVLQRSRLMFHYQDEGLTMRFSGQDARVWGQNGISMAGNTTHIYEAWAKYNFSPNWWVKLGRQELRYDDQRLMGFNDFSLTGATYDAAIFAFENKESETTAHLGAMVNNAAQDNFLSYYGSTYFKYMAYGWFSKSISKELTVNAINIFDLSQKNTNPHIMYGRNTLGANVILKANERLGGRMGGYFQFGETWHDWGNGNFEKLNVSAFSFNASVWLKPISKLTVSLNTDMYSGHDWSSTDPTFTSFNRLLAPGHAFLGFMDYFTTRHLTEVDYAGMYDFFLRVDYAFTSKASLQVTAHLFQMDKPFVRVAGPTRFERVSKNLGTEVDFVFNYKVSKVLALELAWMFISPSSTLERFNSLAPGDSRFSQFGYVSFLLTPNFFKYSKPTE